MEEIWKNISGFEGLYEVSSKGRLRNLSRPVRIHNGKYRTLKERILKLSNLPYRKITLSKEGKIINYYVHRLVAIAFIPNPNNYPVVNHIDGDHLNNTVENLEWCSQKHNIKHSWDTGLSKSIGETHYLTTLSEEDVKVIKFHSEGITMRELAKRFGVSASTICKIKANINWKHITN